MERSCRYCKHYFGGFCRSETILQQLQVEDAICEVLESGKLAEVLREAGLPWDPAGDVDGREAAGAAGHSVKTGGEGGGKKCEPTT